MFVTEKIVDAIIFWWNFKKNKNGKKNIDSQIFLNFPIFSHFYFFLNSKKK